MIGTYFIYNSILIFSTLFVWLSEKAKNGNSRFILLSIAFLIIFIPAAIRYNIGSDYWGYEELYNNYLMGFDIKQEIGYQFLLDILIFFGFPAHSFIILSSFIIYFILFLSYPKKGVTIYHFAYMVVFYLISYNLIRTAIVLSLCLLFFRYYIENRSKIIQFFILLIALSFHQSVVLIIIPLFLIWIKFDKLFKYKLFVLLFIIISIAIFFFKDKFILIIINSGIIELLGYGHYLSLEYFKEVEINTGLGILLKVSLLLFSLYFYSNIEDKYRSIVIVSSIVLIYSIIMQSSIEIFSRVERFYIFGFIFAFLGFYFSKKCYFQKLVLIFAIFWGILFFEMDINKFRSNVCAGGRISPYVTIFNKENDKSWSGISHHECMKW